MKTLNACPMEHTREDSEHKPCFPPTSLAPSRWPKSTAQHSRACGCLCGNGKAPVSWESVWLCHCVNEEQLRCRHVPYRVPGRRVHGSGEALSILGRHVGEVAPEGSREHPQALGDSHQFLLLVAGNLSLLRAAAPPVHQERDPWPCPSLGQLEMPTASLEAANLPVVTLVPGTAQY